MNKDKIKDLMGQLYALIITDSATSNKHSLWQVIKWRLAENFLSVKVWLFLLPFIMSTILLIALAYLDYTFIITVLARTGVEKDTITFASAMMKHLFGAYGNWLTFNVSIVGAIVVVREIFKVRKIQALANGSNNVDKIEEVPS